MACHSTVAPPAVVTTNSSPTRSLIAASASPRFIGSLLEHRARDQERDRALRRLGHGHRATDLLGERTRVAERLVLNVERLKHRLGHQPQYVEGVVTPVAGVVDE